MHNTSIITKKTLVITLASSLALSGVVAFASTMQHESEDAHSEGHNMQISAGEKGVLSEVTNTIHNH